MSKDNWNDEEAAVQAECWSHGFVLPYKDLAAEVAQRRAYEETEDNWRSFLGPLYPKEER